MSLKLFTFANNYRAFKAQIAAAYSGVELEVVDNKSDDFKGVSATGKVPALSTPQGTLFESNAIARYVARLRADTGLLGSSFFQSAQVDQWIDFCANELESRRAIWLYPIFEIIPFDGRAYGTNKNDLKKVLKVLDDHLKKNQFMVGNQVTLADIVITTTLVDLFKLVMTPSYVRPFPNLVRWFTLMINQPKVAATVGQVEFAKKEKMAPKPKKVKAEPKKKKQQQQQKPKPKPKKPKNPLDLLPPSKMRLDAVKKSFFFKQPYDKEFYDNKFIQESFDPEGYSFWTACYDYNDENKVMYMTMNKTKMWFQRLDELRKYGWGRALVCSQDGNEDGQGPFEIHSMWCFRGQEVPREMKDSEGEYHTFTKVDVSTPEGRKALDQYWVSEADKDKLNEKYIHDTIWFK